MPECKGEKNIRECPCTYPNCKRKGLCCDCIRHHLNRNQLPACCFPPEVEKTFDRSVERFIESRKSQ